MVELAEVSEKKRVAVTGFSSAGSIGNTAIMHGVRAEGFRQMAHVHGMVVFVLGGVVVCLCCVVLFWL